MLGILVIEDLIHDSDKMRWAWMCMGSRNDNPLPIWSHPILSLYCMADMLVLRTVPRTKENRAAYFCMSIILFHFISGLTDDDIRWLADAIHYSTVIL